MNEGKRRCDWASRGGALELRYHDEEWGVPTHEDNRLFELLVLEGAQAGLSWSTILRKRESYRTAFHGFDPAKVALYDERKVRDLLADAGIVRNELKVRSAIQNAKACLGVQKGFGSFGSYVWGFVKNRQRINGWRTLDELPSSSVESIAMSRDMLSRGFRFVGPTICYAFMQAGGLVNDHLSYCFRYRALSRNSGARVRHSGT
jgi:DNA-3-methyladenine glycosylase I